MIAVKTVYGDADVEHVKTPYAIPFVIEAPLVAANKVVAPRQAEHVSAAF